MADFNKRQTALNIVQEACAVQGLPVPTSASANPTDVTARQMWALLRNCGRRLCKPTMTHRWQQLTRLWTLDTVPGTTLYTLPADWDSFEDLTGWNTSSRLPMLGPATDPQWQCLKARGMGSSTLGVIYRTTGGKFEIYSSPDTPQTLTINYTSRAWVQSANEPLVFRDYPDTDADIVLFDPELMTAALKLAFMTAKGFDTSAAGAEFAMLLEAAICANTDAPVLHVGGSGTYPLINTQFNVPDTGYGA